MEPFKLEDIDRDHLFEKLDQLDDPYSPEYKSLAFVRQMLYLVDEGVIKGVEDPDGETHYYAT